MDVCENCCWIYTAIYNIVHSESRLIQTSNINPQSSEHGRPKSPAKGTLSGSNSLSSSFVKHERNQSERKLNIKSHQSQRDTRKSANNRFIRVKTILQSNKIFHSQLTKTSRSPVNQSYERMPTLKPMALKKQTHNSDATFMSDLRLQIGLKLSKKLQAKNIQDIVEKYNHDNETISIESEQAGMNHARSVFAIGKMNNLKNTEELDLWDLIIANLKSIVLRPGQRWGTLSKLISKEDLEKRTASKNPPNDTIKIYPELEIKHLPSNSNDVVMQESDLNVSNLSSPKKAVKSSHQINLNSFLDRSESDASPTKGMKDDIGKIDMTEPKQRLIS